MEDKLKTIQKETEQEIEKENKINNERINWNVGCVFD